MYLEGWQLAVSVEENMLNTLVLVLWGYLKYLQSGTHFSLEESLFTELTTILTGRLIE